jgi:hypothetical protein
MPTIHLHLHRRVRDKAKDFQLGSRTDKLWQRIDRLKAQGVDTSTAEKAMRTNNLEAANVIVNRLETGPRDKRKAKDAMDLITVVPGGSTGLDYKVIFPDGTTGVYGDRRLAQREIQSWMSRNNSRAQVEWKIQ